MYGYFLDADRNWSIALSGLLPHTPITVGVFSFFSLVGGSVFAWLAILGYLIATEEKQNKSFIAYFLLSFGTVTFLVHYVIKWIFMRDRPYIRRHIEALSCPQDYSFPSGHAALSFASALIFAHFDPKRRWIYFATAAIISYSRIFLYCHYLSDVVAGAVLGLAVSWFFLLFDKNKKKQGLHRSKARSIKEV